MKKAEEPKTADGENALRIDMNVIIVAPVDRKNIHI